jgi:hypothetical protein
LFDRLSQVRKALLRVEFLIGSLHEFQEQRPI